MSRVKRVKKMSRPRPVASNRRLAREASEQLDIPTPKSPEQQVVHTRKVEKIDPLLAVVQKREEDLRVSACAHPHLRFAQMGAILTCIDCLRRWHTVMEPGVQPDLTYWHPTLNESETRHSLNEAPRGAPKPTEPAKRK